MDTTIFGIIRILLYTYAIYSILSASVIYYKNKKYELVAIHLSFVAVLAINQVALIFKLTGSNNQKIFFDYAMTLALFILATSVWIYTFRYDKETKFINIKEIKDIGRCTTDSSGG